MARISLDGRIGRDTQETGIGRQRQIGDAGQAGDSLDLAALWMKREDLTPIAGLAADPDGHAGALAANEGDMPGVEKPAQIGLACGRERLQFAGHDVSGR